MEVIKHPFRYSSNLSNKRGWPNKHGVHMQVKKHGVEKKLSKRIRCVSSTVIT